MGVRLDDAPVLGFDQLTSGVAAVAAEASHHGPVVYAQQERFGGLGFDAAVVWRSGRVAFGPRFTANHGSERLTGDYVVVDATIGSAINAALRSAGVDRGGAVDEYAAIGLDRHRTTDAWLDDSS